MTTINQPDTTNGRKALHAYVTDEAHDTWHGFAADQGISVSGLLEALAPELDFATETSDEPINARLRSIVMNARRVDAARRRRRR